MSRKAKKARGRWRVGPRRRTQRGSLTGAGSPGRTTERAAGRSGGPGTARPGDPSLPAAPGGRECWSTPGPREARRRASPSPAGRTAGRPGPQGGEKGSARACARRERTPAALRPHVPPWERGPRGRPPGDTRARGGRAHRLPLLPRPSPGRRAPARQGRGRRAGRPDAQGRARRCAPPPRGSVHPAPPTRRTGRAPFPHRPGQGRRARPAKPLPLAGSGRGGTPGRGAARGRRERRMGKEGCEPPPPRLPPRQGRRDDGMTNPCVEG